MKPLPHKSEFFPFNSTYLNSGVQHPVSKGCVEAANEYLTYKGFHTDINIDPFALRKEVLGLYAELINADPVDIAYVQSTTVGENLIIQALDLVNKKGRVVTDDLHYFGSYQIYGELQKQGVEVITIRNKDGAIDLDDYKRAITDDTDLVAVSSVSTFNGYQHDLKTLCDIAHKHGALVYADAIHHIGATPFDVKETNVDFCSAGTFKWLMADQGLGFLYVKQGLLKSLKRPWYGKRQVKNLVTHVFPGDDITNDQNIYEYELAETAEGYFSIWSEPRIVMAQLKYSLSYLLETSVEAITEYRQPLLKKAREEITKLGFHCLTPEGTITPLLAFECENATKTLGATLKKANIQASLYKGHFRIAFSVFNDMDDVDHLVNTLKSVRYAE
ncbi:aminotransferase class V-fold PLP-dependent enzyme [Pseudemcibacter aquimaris]|uniref:aminotransferase class V-fold PLP-dependent enzyme n=1 Tax=Pseudemcibacter aquimaris TaxID=2857064 RepID=UPI002011A585|nr:aminotransferase class V-fold PLP-dependent enzyme [Pseudemcibacter aquimaris]MCC3859807.1 aminotransferase class V-fold PLP-dependent enzyme [Pseudemcibacter aquimaris]WDU60201.1 aminotransferase class V-fold PLP-dependent enzyme [Pseudemcibacter aquimaris]